MKRLDPPGRHSAGWHIFGEVDYGLPQLRLGDHNGKHICLDCNVCRRGGCFTRNILARVRKRAESQTARNRSIAQQA